MLKEILKKRRAYRSLKPLEVTDELINDLATSAGLAPSCYNKQPWRYVFVYEESALKKLQGALAGGNSWAKKASLLVAVFSRKDLDCIVKDREYYLFDTGMSTGFLLLRATEMGLVAHPMAGFDEEKAKEALNIPDDMKVIALIAIGSYSEEIDPDLPEKMAEMEKKRPPRKAVEEFTYKNIFS